jgi:hypothetical protein
MSLDPRIEAIISVGSRLVDVMEREIAILREMRPGDIAALQDDKAKLVAAYEEQLAGLKGEPELVAALAPPIKDELARVATRLNATVAENERALAAARVANERLLKAVIDALAEDRDRRAGYSRTGKRAGTGPARRGTPVSLSLNTTL